MNLRKIDDQIQLLENQGYHTSATYLREFKSLVQVEHYISNDAENYWEVKCYVDLLTDMAKLLGFKISLDQIEGKEEGDVWKFNFKINGHLEEIEMNNPHTDWFQEIFLDKVNEAIERYGYEPNKNYRLVWATSEYDSDQCFDMVFIDDDNFNKLLDTTPRYAHTDSE